MEINFSNDAIKRIEFTINLIQNRIGRLSSTAGLTGFKVELERKLSAGLNNMNSKLAKNILTNNVLANSKEQIKRVPDAIKDVNEDILSGIKDNPDIGKIVLLADKLCGNIGVDPDLVKAMIKTESNFNTGATSKCGAMGLMQLMPATAKSLGVDNAYDIYQNLNGGIKLIKNLIDSFGGDIKLALAAYNAGSGRVREYGGVPPIPETQNYVYKILSVYNPDLL